MIQAGANLTSSDGTSRQFALGTEFNVDGSTYRYVISAGAIAQYALCTLSIADVATEGTTTTAGTQPTDCVIPQFAIAGAGEYFWAPVGPFKLKADGSAFQVKSLASNVALSKQYTTATSGVIDDTATKLVQGLTITATVGASAANVACVATGRLLINAQD